MDDKQYKINQGSIYLEITSKCNLHCSYCYNDSNTTGHQLPLDIIKKIMEYSSSVGVNNMSISGGEPFLHSDIFGIFEYANKINMHLYIVTNGSMLNKDTFERMKPFMDLLSFQFTFDGFNMETHAKYRGRDNYSKIKYCISHMIDSGYTDHMFIRYNITSYNFSEVYDFLEYCAKMRCRTVSLSYILNQGRANKEMLVTESQTKVVKALVDKAKSKFTDLSIKFTEKPVVTCPYALVKPNQELTFLPRIDSDGNVYPCQVEVNPDFIIGNIYRDDLLNIMHSRKFHEYIAFVTEKENRNAECQNCTFSMLCGGGCVAMRTPCSKIKTEILHEFLYSTSY